jgi:hypothetical protein
MLELPLELAGSAYDSPSWRTAFTLVDGGKDGIRTHGSLATSTVFEILDRHPPASGSVQPHPP